jgi:hypothetical protein
MYRFAHISCWTTMLSDTFDCCIRCWYCKDHIDWLYDDHISFHLKPQILQLHNWIDWVLSILCLSSVKLSADLQSVQQQYDSTFVSWSTPNWTKLVLNVINQYVINFTHSSHSLYVLIMLGKTFRLINLHFLNKYLNIKVETFCPVILRNIFL